MNPAVLPITLDDVRAARLRIAPHVHRTPVLTSRQLDERLGCRIFFKAEIFQRVGAFKARGAFSRLTLLTPEERQRGVVAFSSGNHAQAIALAARELGVKATIVMPMDAPASKVAATRGYGAQVVLYDRFKEDREAIGRAMASERGLALIPPFDHPHVIAGQGTATKELIEDAGPLDYLFVCMGGGGLVSGSALAAHALAPSCKIYGVEPEAGNDGQRSFRSGEIVSIATPKTIADGAQTQHVGKLTFAIARRELTDVVTATDAQLVEAMRFFAERMKMIVEPTGCLSFAGARHAGLPIQGKRVGVVISGGNVDLERYAELLRSGE